MKEKWIQPGEMKAENFPNELKDRHQWVCWKREARDGKDTKPPINPLTGRLASVTEPTSWSDFATALKQARSYDGIGYVLTQDDGIVMVDLDHCRDPENGSIQPWALKIVKRLMSYTEISPSKRGLKILIRAKHSEKRNRSDKLPGDHSVEARIEIYGSARYTTLTGHLLHPNLSNLSRINERQRQLNSLYDELFPAATSDDPVPTNDERILELARNEYGIKFRSLFDESTEGYLSPSEADLALCHMFAQFTSDPNQINRLFARSKLHRDKWDEPRGDRTYGQMTVVRALDFKPDGKLIANTGLRLIKVSELLEEPAEEHEFILDNVLPKNGLSVLVSKPKVGKTTLALNLAVAVARGEGFLGIATRKSPVVYLGLSGEVKRDELKKFFKLRGVSDELIYTFADVTPPNLVSELEKMLENHRAPLVIIDTLAKALSVKDFNNYAEVTARLTPYAELARQMVGHILFLHHSPKRLVGDPVDSVLGSTAVSGGVDTVLVLDRRGENRIVKGVQRYGEPLNDLLYAYDKKRGMIIPLGDPQEFETGQVSEEIKTLLLNSAKPLTTDDICNDIESRKQTIIDALRELTRRGIIVRSGSGVSGDPYRYAKAGNSGTDNSGNCRNSGTD